MNKMLYCEKCKLNISGNFERCPLCEEDLTGEADKINTFPDVICTRKGNLALKILILCTVIALVICFAVNMIFGAAEFTGAKPAYWLNFVIAGFMSFWLIAGVLIKNRKNPAKMLLCFSCTVSLLVILWDFLTGFSGWSTGFVLPFLYAFVIILTVILKFCLRLKAGDYLYYLTADILLGMIPLILFLFGVQKVVYPSAICTAISVIVLTVLVVFKGKILKQELIRRLHI